MSHRIILKFTHVIFQTLSRQAVSFDENYDVKIFFAIIKTQIESIIEETHKFYQCLGRKEAVDDFYLKNNRTAIYHSQFKI